MKLEQQVCNLEISNKLCELGVTQESLFYWSNPAIDEKPNWYVTQNIANYIEHYSAFTVAELGEMLPKGFRSGKSGNAKNGKFKAYGFSCFDSHCNGINSAISKRQTTRESFNEDTEADARGKMLIYLLENKLIDLK